ncbi:MAG: hypothetical protein FJW20_04335 [Acidimicrobiia bacterium]|nr:hypothetical protein [Acidimicrobiia bacterium]
MVSSNSPVTRGQVVELFATGLGAVRPQVPFGHPAPGPPQELARLAQPGILATVFPS